MDNQAPLVRKLLDICYQAGKIILKYYYGRAKVTLKSDNSPVTCADLEADYFITSELKKITPDYPVLSEENNKIPYSERLSWKQYWLVDPLDGTQSFIDQKDEFCINIALIEKNRPTLGIVYVPISQTAYFGGYDTGGCWRQSIGQQAISIKTRPRRQNDIIRLLTSRNLDARPDKTFFQKLETYFQKVHLIAMSSAVKVGLIAEGSADFYLRHGVSFEWDIAASESIIKSAGGALLNTKFEAVNYNKNDLTNPNFFIAGDMMIPWKKLMLK